MQRRTFITSLCSLAALGATPISVTASGLRNSRKCIDMEHHFMSKAFLEFLAARKDRKEYPYFDDKLGVVHRKGVIFPIAKNRVEFNPPYQIYDEMTDVDRLRIKIMDECGVGRAAISSIDGIEVLPKVDCVRIARATNDEIAAAVKKHPDRFFGTFCLPTPYVEESLAEIDRAVDVLGLKYWHTHSSYGGVALDDKRFEPIFAKLSKKNVAFYLHPAYPTASYLLDSGNVFASAGFGFGVDTMKTTIRLFMTGMFDRYPNLKMILGHMAEFYPYIIDRMDNRFSNMRHLDGDLIKMQHGFEYYFKNGNVFMTTSGIFDPEVVLFAIKKFGADRVMFGTDYPCEKFKASREFIENLPISEADKEKILFRNAEKYILKL